MACSRAFSSHPRASSSSACIAPASSAPRTSRPQGGYILAGNHVSYLDPMLLWSGTLHPRPTSSRSRSSSTPRSWAGDSVALWSFPITRASADREAIQRATDLLKRGEPCRHLPRGHPSSDPAQRTDEPAEAHAGVAFIAMRAGVPVVPVGIAGTERALPPGAKFPRFPRVTIRYGEPVSPRGLRRGRSQGAARRP